MFLDVIQRGKGLLEGVNTRRQESLGAILKPSHKQNYPESHAVPAKQADIKIIMQGKCLYYLTYKLQNNEFYIPALHKNKTCLFIFCKAKKLLKFFNLGLNKQAKPSIIRKHKMQKKTFSPSINGLI